MGDGDFQGAGLSGILCICTFFLKVKCLQATVTLLPIDLLPQPPLLTLSGEALRSLAVKFTQARQAVWTRGRVTIQLST